MQSAGKNVTNDVSSLFSDDSRGYLINGGPYKVSAEVLKRLTSGNVKVEGTGSVKWVNFSSSVNAGTNPDPFTGVIPVSKLSDPFYLSTALPSDLQTAHTYRVNPGNLYPAASNYHYIKPIGAVYKANNATLADTDTVTVCLGEIHLLLYTDAKGWFESTAGEDLGWAKMFGLPSGKGIGNYSLTNNKKATRVDNAYYKYTVTGADFNGKKFGKAAATGGYFHFWGKNYYAADATKIRGVIVAYTAWIQEENMVGKFAATVAADWRETESGSTSQAFSGRNYTLTTEKQMFIGCNIGPNTYDTLMSADNVKKVKSLLGMK